MDIELLKSAWACKCPKCGIGNLYKPGLTLSLRDKCESCGIDLGKNDSGDGPAVFLIFILGFSLVPLALLLEVAAHPPLWVHIVLWGGLALLLTVGSLRPLKAYIIALQFKHRPGEWK